MSVSRYLTFAAASLLVMTASVCVVAGAATKNASHPTTKHLTNFAKKFDTAACERWVDSVYSSLTPRQRVAQLFFPKVVPTRGDVSRNTIKNFVKNNEVGGLIFTEGFIDHYADMTDYAQSVARVPLLMTFDFMWGILLILLHYF